MGLIIILVGFFVVVVVCFSLGMVLNLIIYKTKLWIKFFTYFIFPLFSTEMHMHHWIMKLLIAEKHK